MIRLAFGDLGARPARWLSTVLSVAFGVAFVVGVLVLTDTVRTAFDDRYVEGGQGAAGVVRPAGGLETQRYARIPDRVNAAVAGVPGVAAVAPVYTQSVRLTGASGAELGRSATDAARLDRAPLQVGAWSDVPELRDQRLRSGRPPSARREIAVHRHIARLYGLAVGAQVRVVLTNTVFDATVTGIFDYGDADPAPRAPLFTPAVLVSPEAAAAVLGDPRALRVQAARGAAPADVRTAIRRLLDDAAAGAGDRAATRYEVVPASVDARQTFALIWRQSMGPLATGLLVFAGITVLAASMIVFSTFTITVAQRTRQYALLRVVGASRRQVVAAVLVEALAIGLLGGAVGVLLGLGMTHVLRALFTAVGIDLVIGATDPTILRPRAALVAVITGAVAAVVAAQVPAVRASRVPPLQALREPDLPARRGTSRAVTRAGLVVLAVSMAVLGIALAGAGGDESDVAARVLPLGAGALGVFVATALLAPRFTGPVARLVGVPAAALRGVPGELARANAIRNPGRAALTAAPVLLGVGLVSFTLVVTSSLDATQQIRVERLTFTDFQLRPNGLDSFPAEATEAVAAVEGVAVATAIRPAQVNVAGAPQYGLAIEPRGFLAVAHPQGVTGDLGALARDTGAGPALVALSTAKAAQLGVGVGDTLPTVFNGGGPGAGRYETRVVAIYDPDRLPEGYGADILISRDRAAAADPMQGDTTTLIELQNGVTHSEARPALENALRGLPVVLQDPQQARASMSGRVGSLLSLGLGMLLLTVVIALFGITNTMALSVTERTRELGLLRAVGLSRGQARTMVRWEAIIVTLLGLLLGISLGVFFAWLTTRVVTAEFDTFVLPAGWLALTVVAGAAAALLATIVPARRASNVEILRAIAHE